MGERFALVEGRSISIFVHKIGLCVAKEAKKAETLSDEVFPPLILGVILGVCYLFI